MAAVAGLTRDIPWDLGDSLLNSWFCGTPNVLLDFSVRHRRDPELLEREHLYPEADARYSEHPVRAGGPDSRSTRCRQRILFTPAVLSTFVLSGSVCFCSCATSPAARRGLVAGLVTRSRPTAFRSFRTSRSSPRSGCVRALWSAAILRDETRPGARRRRLRAHRVAQTLRMGTSCSSRTVVVAYALFEIATRTSGRTCACGWPSATASSSPW